MSECVHEVTTWRDEHGTPMLYGCIKCKVKFVPATESFDKIARLEAECAALKAEQEESRSYRVMAAPVTDEELMAYASEAQFFLFASEDEVLDIMRETLLAFASRCASKTINRLKDENAKLRFQVKETDNPPDAMQAGEKP